MDFEVIIIGGSAAGLQAGMTLGRALRKVLIIDSGKPCNRQTPHSHNFLTRDGETPATIANIARTQLATYPTVTLMKGLAVKGERTTAGFTVTTDTGDAFSSRKLFLATGIKDIFPDIPGLAECWGISVIHCPYCHGYEVKGETTGILANGDMAYEFIKLISHWTSDLTLFTNGPSTLSDAQAEKILSKGIKVNTTPIREIIHQSGNLSALLLEDGTQISLKALYARLPFVQHSDIPVQLGCELNEMGFIKVADFGVTTIPGVVAAGDNCSMMRSLGNAVGSASAAAAFMNKEMLEEDF